MQARLAWLACFLTILGACAGGDGATYRGMVSASAEEGESGGRWVVLVKLDGSRIGGSSTVQVAFDKMALACDDGTALQPDQIEIGADITFVRVGDDYETMSPPIIGGTSVALSC